MKKLLSSLMLLTLVVLFAATYVCSSRTEEVFRAQIEQLNQNYAGLFQVELLDYQRGLLVSEVKTRVALQKDIIPLQHRIRHFPWKVKMLSSVAEDSAEAVRLAERIPLDQLQLQTDVTLNGASQSLLTLPELSFVDEKTQLTLKGLQFDCRLGEQLSAGQLTFRLEHLHIIEPPEAELVITDVQLDSQFSDLLGLPLGGGEVRIGLISLQPQARPGFEFSDLRYHATSRLEEETLTSGFAVQLAALELGGETFTDGKLQLQISGINVATVREMQTAARQLQADLLSQQVDPLILQLQLLALYSQLFKDGLTVSLDQLTLHADEGLLQGQGSLTAQELNFSGASMLALDKLNGHFRLDVDRPVFNAGFRMFDKLQRHAQKSNPAVLNEQAEQVAGGLIQKGIFIRRDGGYRFEITIDQGQAELNGHPFRL